MQVQKNVSLLNYNTFGVEVYSHNFVEVNEVHTVKNLIESGYLDQNYLILGGGSNVLFTKDFDGLIIRNTITGIELIEKNSHYLVKAGAGVVWHKLVEFCIAQDISGIENLSLIPGSCGAAPIQNIGAYGVELKDVFNELEAIDLETGMTKTFTKDDCDFGYRNSVFKNELKGQYLIISLTLQLKKKFEFNTSYGAIENELQNLGVEKLSPKIISQAVCNIRRSKLPDPEELGNAGSFFKNPIISNDHFLELQKSNPDIKYYTLEDGQVKVPAGWLIEKSGWKGQRFGNYGVHKNQALVLVNYGGAQGQEIYDLSERILKDIKSKFDIALEREVNIIL
ncbi:MAG: UDP-N-acetylmuramate dehydrogenase [Flavobacteriales bacterium]|nr:UDP-N-acetylmuramate dehydrogenase [Flavobacteriales bacterium]